MSEGFSAASESQAALDEWMREPSPSEELRRWYHSGLSTRGEFRRRYLSELKNHRHQLKSLAQRTQARRVALIHAAADEERNNAVVMQQYLKMLGAEE